MSTNQLTTPLPDGNDFKQLAARLEHVRKILELTQAEFAQLMGVSLSAYKRYLAGASPSIDSFIGLYQDQRASPYCWWLLTNDPKPNVSSEALTSILQKTLEFIQALEWITISPNSNIDSITTIMVNAIVGKPPD